MRGNRLMLCGFTFALTVLHAAAAPPDQSKPPGRVPPKAATTPTPMITAVRNPFTLQPCTAVGTVTFDAAYNAKFPGAVRYVGPMTFTANVDMRAVLMYTMNYNEGQGMFFLGGCTCPEFPKGGDNPAIAPPNSNFKRLESRTYQLSCAWPTGGLPQNGPFRFEVDITYFTNAGGADWKKTGAKCGNLTVVK